MVCGSHPTGLTEESLSMEKNAGDDSKLKWSLHSSRFKKLRLVLIFASLIAMVWVWASGFLFGRIGLGENTKLMTLVSPDESHSAELFRYDHLDRNYIVEVDGRRVYISPD